MKRKKKTKEIIWTTDILNRLEILETGEVELAAQELNDLNFTLGYYFQINHNMKCTSLQICRRS